MIRTNSKENSELGIRNWESKRGHSAFRIPHSQFSCWAVVFWAWFLTISTVAEAGLSVSPPRTVLQGKPNKTLTGYFTLTNSEEHPLQVRVEPEDWAGGIGGARGPVPWLKVKPTELTLRPGKPSRVKFTVRIPKDASGELRAQVFFTTQEVPDASSGEGAVSLRSRLGAIIYVVAEGTERIEGAVTKVQAFYAASTPGVARPDRLEVVMGIHNRSNTHVVPDGRVDLRNDKGEIVETVPLQSGWGLLPNEEDTYRAIKHGVHLKPGRYTFELTIVIGDDLRHPVEMTKTAEIVVEKTGALRLLASPATP